MTKTKRHKALHKAGKYVFRIRVTKRNTNTGADDILTENFKYPYHPFAGTSLWSLSRNALQTSSSLIGKVPQMDNRE